MSRDMKVNDKRIETFLKLLRYIQVPSTARRKEIKKDKIVTMREQVRRMHCSVIV